jgi:hypothetical protein
MEASGQLAFNASVRQDTFEDYAMATVVQSPEVRKAMSVSSRVDEIAEDIDTDNCGTIQALIYDCDALARQWRSTVEFISNLAVSEKSVDFRYLGEILAPAASRTKDIYCAVENMAQSSPCKPHGMSDLTLAMIEIPNVIKWIASWPTNDPSRRNAARQAFANGDCCTNDDLLG